MARVNRENKPDSSSSARNQYGNRSSLLESDRSRHINRDHSRFNGDITLAKRGKYISVLSTETPDSQKSVKIQHIKREQLGSKMINREQNGGNRFIMPQNSDTDNTVGNKYQHKALSDVSASETKNATGNANIKSSAIEKYTAAQTRVNLRAAAYKSEDRNATFAEKEMLAERAAAIQEQLKRSTAAEKYNTKSENAKNEAMAAKNEEASSKGKYFSGTNGQYDPNNKADRAKAENAARYTEYLKGQALYKYQKKVYKIKAKQYKPSSVDKLKGTISLAKRVTDPMKSGDIGKAVMLPASELVDYVIRKHKGDILLKHRDRLKKGMEAAENASDTGTAMYAAAQTIVTDTVKSTAANAVKSLDRAVSDKIQTNLDNKKIQKANKYLNKEYQKADEIHQNVYEGKISNKQLKQLEKFEEQNKDNKLNKKIYNKYMNKSEQLDKLEKKQQEAAKGQYAKSQKAKSLNKKAEAAKAAEEKKVKAGIFKDNAKAFAGKAFHAVKSQTLKIVGAGGSAVVAPILLIIIIITLIALLFSWQNAFKIQLSDREITAETEEEILDGYMQMIYDFMQTAEYRCFLTYGNYCDAQYDWEDAELSFDDYYNEVLLPLIEQEKAKITAAYGPAIASASPSDRGAIIAKMSQEISEFVNATLEKGKEEFDEILQQLNDYLREPTSFPPSIWKYDPDPNKAGYLIDDSFYIAETYTQCELADLTDPEGDGNDAAQYAGQQICSNDFDLGSLKFDTELTAEDIFPYIALSRVISIMNDGNNSNDEDESKTALNISGEITVDEINAFFQKTEFICIDAHLTGYDCGKCRRKLVGDWETGWEWQYYCRETTDTYHHQILSGSISVKNEKELLDAVMIAYGAKEAGLSEDDCLSLVNTYREYVKDTLGNTEHLIGKNDYALAEYFYLMTLRGYGPPPSPWSFYAPLETDEDEKGEEISEATK